MFGGRKLRACLERKLRGNGSWRSPCLLAGGLNVIDLAMPGKFSLSRLPVRTGVQAQRLDRSGRETLHQRWMSFKDAASHVALTSARAGAPKSNACEAVSSSHCSRSHAESYHDFASGCL